MLVFVWAVLGLSAFQSLANPVYAADRVITVNSTEAQLREIAKDGNDGAWNGKVKR